MSYVKFAFAAPIFFISWYFFFVSVHLLLNSEASMMRIVVGGTGSLLAILISGYIMAPVVAEQIASRVAVYIQPLLGLLPGGRRRTDPPPPPADGDPDA